MRFGDLIQHVRNISIVGEISFIEISRGLEIEMMNDPYVSDYISNALRTNTLNGLTINGHRITVDRANHKRVCNIHLKEPVLRLEDK